MAFEIDHDWQGNLATPRARIGEAAKTRLLIILCCIWICIGLIGHHPWKPNESTSISIIKAMLAGEHLLDPIAVGETVIKNPPLYYPDHLRIGARDRLDRDAVVLLLIDDLDAVGDPAGRITEIGRIIKLNRAVAHEVARGAKRAMDLVGRTPLLAAGQ